MNATILRSSFAAFAGAAMVLFGACDRVGAADAEESSLEVSIPWQGKREIVYTGYPAHFDVTLTNTSGQPVKIWDGAAGYGALYFELTDEHGETRTVVREPLAETGSRPDFARMLGPHEQWVIQIDYPTTKWLGFPHPHTGDPETFTMQAVFESKPNEVSKRFGVWIGRVVSKGEKYVFRNS